MKILIIDDSGNHVSVDPKSILIQGKPLIDWLGELESLKKEFRAFAESSRRREDELVKMWRSIK
jgi:hypothetical protein